MTTLEYVRIRWGKLMAELAHLPRTLALVHQAAGNLTALWVSLLALQGLLPVATVYLTRALVNSILAAVHAGYEWHALRPAVVLAAWMGAVVLASQLLRGLTSWVRTAQSEMVRDHLAGLIQKKSLEVDLSFYDSSDFYDHLHRARMDATHRPVEILESIGSLFQGSVTAIAIVAILIPFGPLPPLALLLSAVPVLYVMVNMAQRRHRWNLATTIDNRRSWYYDTLLTDGDSAAEMRLFDLGGHFLNAFQQIRQRLRQERLNLARQESVSELFAGILVLMILAVSMAWMAWRTVRGQVSLGDLALFYQAFNQGLGVSRTLLDNLGKLYENSLFLGNLFEFLDLKPQLVSPQRGHAVPMSLSKGIRFEKVSFRYPGSRRQALTDFNLDILPGQTVALVGPNGTGKSTLVKLLCRFYDPESGSISVDGIPIQEFSISELRRLMTVFFQQPVRYNDSVSANIGFGDLKLERARFSSAMEKAAGISGLDEIIARLPDGYDTQLGRGFHDGTELSVGEWHRVALARASIRQAPILILDEPTSAMDPWAEIKWAERMRETAAGRITILITHRFSTAMFADVIHVVSEGRVVESGSHAQLLAKGGIYAEGWAAQERA